jgi:hypothetical protein
MDSPGQHAFSGGTDSLTLISVAGGVFSYAVDFLGPDHPGVFTMLIERLSSMFDMNYTMADLEAAREKTLSSELDDEIVAVERGDRMVLLRTFSEMVLAESGGINEPAAAILEKVGERLDLASATIEREVMAVVAEANWA